LWVGEQKAAGGFDGDDLAAAMELPLERLASDRIAELEAAVAGEVGGGCRAAVFLQVGRGGDGDDSGFEQLAGDQGGGRGWLDEANSEIEAFGGQVAEFSAGEEFEGDLRVAVEEAGYVRGQEKAREDWVYIDAQAAADDSGGAGGQGDRFADTGEQGADLFVEAAAVGGEGEGACGPVEEANADAGFEAGDGSADGGLGDAEGCGGADKAAGFDDSSEHADAVEKTIIDATPRAGSHDSYLLVMIVVRLMDELHD
jgi:hypothetical protein